MTPRVLAFLVLAAPAWAQSMPAPRQAVSSSPAPAPRFTCDGRQYCREMRSCEEALFFLNTCGVRRLDSDSDGIPCERTHCPANGTGARRR